jgi:hypothetical protein
MEGDAPRRKGEEEDEMMWIIVAMANVKQS